MSNSHKTEQKILYRIFTENINSEETHTLVSKYFDGFSISYGSGYWEGNAESSIVIETIGDYTDKSKVLKLAGEIKKLNGQQVVLVFTTTGFVNEI